MKKSSRKSVPKTRKAKSPVAAETVPTPNRRRVLYQVLGAAGVGVTGWWAAGAVRATALEQDLSRMGQGLPTIVQIHDPQCPMCNQLQREAREALQCMDTDGLVYLVANIRGDEGRGFAARYASSHVTLLLFDGAGALQGRISGVHEHEVLKPQFRALLT